MHQETWGGFEACPPLPESKDEGPGKAGTQQFFSALNWERASERTLIQITSTHGTAWLKQDCCVSWETM